MYNPKPFGDLKRSDLVSFIKQYPLATVISNGHDIPVVSNLPLLIDKEGLLITGHMANANPHLAILKKQPKVLLIFQGPNHIITSYHKNPEKPDILPTWNYQIVHLTGNLNLMTERETSTLLERMVKEFEAPYPEQIDLKDYDQNEYSRKLKMITGFKIQIESIKGCFRLGQNRSNAIVKNIVDTLEKEDNYSSREIAEAMKKFNSL